jgi:hypothetical protein
MEGGQSFAFTLIPKNQGKGPYCYLFHNCHQLLLCCMPGCGNRCANSFSSPTVSNFGADCDLRASQCHFSGKSHICWVACWLLSQVVRRITERGYRNMAGSKNPEASVTGALSRDVLFTRLGPATYALAVRTAAA